MMMKNKLFHKETYGTDVTRYYFKDRCIGRKSDKCYYWFDWYCGWKSWKFELTYDICGYEDGYARLNISMFGWHSRFTLPWKSKRFPDGECDVPQYGISIHDNTVWIMRGGDGNMNGGSKWWVWDIPFFTKEHVRRAVECIPVKGVSPVVMVDVKDMDRSYGKKYVPIYEARPFRIGQEYYAPNVYSYNYTDAYDGAVVPCKYWVEEREWRPKWLTWTGLFKDVHRYIEIDFSDEVGSQKGTWKGGCMGCGYDLLPGELPQECIERMEKERKF